MIQCYSIVLWKKAETKDKPFDEIAKEAFLTLDILQKFSVEFRPNYLTASPKKEVKELRWDYDCFYKLLRNGVNKEGKEIFEDLGYSLSFFHPKRMKNLAVSICMLALKTKDY